MNKIIQNFNKKIPQIKKLRVYTTTSNRTVMVTTGGMTYLHTQGITCLEWRQVDQKCWGGGGGAAMPQNIKKRWEEKGRGYGNTYWREQHDLRGTTWMSAITPSSQHVERRQGGRE
jgi:hypothetical protein